MPLEYVSGPHASVLIGGGAHGKVLSVQADDESCRWNGFPVYLFGCGIGPGGSAASPTSAQFTDPLTLGPSGTSTAVDWPPVYIENALQAVLSGFKLQAKITGTFLTPGIFGNAFVTNPFSGLCVTWNETEGNPADTGWVDCYGSCLQMGTEETLTLSPAVSNGSSVISWQFSGWFLETRWVASGVAATYCPNRPGFIGWNPPCIGADYEGLFIDLKTDSCGNLVWTYNQVADGINALGLGLTASATGGHGGDIATPDPLCTSRPVAWPCCFGNVLIEACEMSGAICSGALDTDEGN